MSYFYRTKAAFVDCDKIKSLFSSSNCIVAVSVGQAAHEGENFRATMALVNKHFRQCMILIGDSLQRHNFSFIQPQHNQTKNNYQQALFLGEQWLLRNSSSLANLSIPYTIRRWDDWLKTNKFKKNLQLIEKSYEDNIELREAVNLTIEEFIYRFYNRKGNNSFPKEIIFNNSKNYLLEEIAILKLMLPTENYNYLVYPNKISPALAKAYEIFVKPNYPHLMKWLHVRLRKLPIAAPTANEKNYEHYSLSKTGS